MQNLLSPFILKSEIQLLKWTIWLQICVMGPLAAWVSCHGPIFSVKRSGHSVENNNWAHHYNNHPHKFEAHPWKKRSLIVSSLNIWVPVCFLLYVNLPPTFFHVNAFLTENPYCDLIFSNSCNIWKYNVDLVICHQIIDTCRTWKWKIIIIDKSSTKVWNSGKTNAFTKICWYFTHIWCSVC